MTTKLRVGAVLAATLFLGGLAALWWGELRSEPVAPPGPAEPDAPAAAEAARAVETDARAERTPLQASTQPAASLAPAGAVVRGRVLDPHGTALAGVDVFRRPTADERGPQQALDRTAFEPVAGDWERLGRSAADGSFEVRLSASGWLAVGPPYIAVRTWPLGAERQDGCVVVAARAVAIAGVVTDQQGQPLAGVEISGFCERLPTFPDVLDHNDRPSFLGGQTDGSGRFALARVPGCEAVELSFTKAGYESAALACPSFDRSDYAVVLRRPDGHRFAGHVYDPAGAPVAGATVGYGEVSTTTDERGSYSFGVARLDDREVLFAAKAGFLAAVARDIAAQPPAPQARTHVRDLYLRAPLAAITGHILQADGEPWPGMQVYLWDVGYLGSSGFTVEGLRLGDEDWIGISATTDPSGAFALEGLDDRPYRLRLFDPSVPFGWTTEPIPAGSGGVEVRVPEDALRDEVRGTVVDSAGRGVAGVRVQYRVDRRMRDGQGVFTTGGGAVTDAAGNFAMRRVPRDEALLLVAGDAIMPTSMLLEPNAPDTGLRIAVHRRCQLRVEAPGAPAGAAFVVLDQQGQPLTVRQFMHDGYIQEVRWRLAEGKTQVLTVSDQARTVVLMDGEKELGRRAVALRPGAVTEVMF